MIENEKIDKFVEEQSPEALVGFLSQLALWAYAYRGDLQILSAAMELEELVFSKDDADWLEKVSEFLKENQELIEKLRYGKDLS